MAVGVGYSCTSGPSSIVSLAACDNYLEVFGFYNGEDPVSMHKRTDWLPRDTFVVQWSSVS